MNKLNMKLIWAISLVVIGINLIFSIEFFSQISIFFAIMVVITELVRAIYVKTYKYVENIVVKIIIIIICLSASIFSFLGVISNGYNFISMNQQKQFKIVKNDSYIAGLKEKKSKQKTLDSYRNELLNYPTFDNYVNSIPKYERSENMITQYNTEKAKINDNINKIQNEINQIKLPEEFKKVKNETTGYNSLFEEIAKLSGAKVSTLFLILMVFIAILMEMIIYSSLIISKFETKKTVQEKEENIKISSDISDQTKSLEQKIQTKQLENIPLDASNVNESNISDQFQTNINNINIVKKSKSEKFENDKYSKIKNYLLSKYVGGEKISKFQNDFELTLTEYRNIIKKLKDDDVIFTLKSNTYLVDKNSNIRIVK